MNDTTRLDWLEEHKPIISRPVPLNKTWGIMTHYDVTFSAGTLREAIDMAMRTADREDKARKAAALIDMARKAAGS